MNIVFRVDSSARMGSGHLMRCLTLANELHRQGANVCFVSRFHRGHLIHKLEAAEYVVHKLPESLDDSNGLSGYEAWLGVSVEQDYQETLGVLDGQTYDWLIVDHYGLDKIWESALRINANKIMVIDDLADRTHDCDVLLDQNYFGSETNVRYTDYVSASTHLLLGPKYALLQPEYAQLSALSVPSDGVVRRVLVFLGNSDWNNQTGAVLEALNCPELSHLLVDVVVGSNHPNLKALEQLVSDKEQLVLHYDLPTLAGLMARSDLVIGAGGATTWERMCLGRPSIATCIAENQRQLSQQLAADGYQILLGDEKMKSSDAWYQAILHIINEPLRLKDMSVASAQLVDGFGVRRVVKKLMDEENSILSIRHANIKDEQLLFDWVNDRMVREQSFRQNPITEREHKTWFDKTLRDPNILIFIAEDVSQIPLGQVRFDLDLCKQEALIDISIDSQRRGEKIAQKLLNQAMKECSLLLPEITFVAEVRSSNMHSQKFFKHMGFKQVSSNIQASVRFEFQIETSTVFNVKEKI